MHVCTILHSGSGQTLASTLPPLEPRRIHFAPQRYLVGPLTFPPFRSISYHGSNERLGGSNRVTKAAVFVSSTCYDLKQVRADMFQFLDGLGFEPVLSEYNSFPIQPDANTIENCLAVVSTKADIFVLIIGGRYGSVTDDGRSVTNREYLSARAKGIPIYVFVQRSVLDLLRVWKANQSGDFSSAVDSPKIFEFVSELHEVGDKWIIPFETAQDVFAALKVQLAYLFRDSLQLRLRASQSGALSRRFRHIDGKELRLLIERPKGWEYLLLGAALRREFEALDDVKRDWQYLDPA